ncbi:Galactosyl transferase [Penicillium vulpinum]|uniref:Galactosyl transferase n=1 Tax=Penicillium vulpinum TaxID=29845 RepID=UPI00254827A1|nr:Galactosyl transferase [Penicillium vulpinum]KAJ5951722.1 Galactosyl transferase [Penicillium vulpinum]
MRRARSGLMFPRRVTAIFTSSLIANYFRWTVESSSHSSTVHELYNPYRHPITRTIFIGHTGKTFWLAEPLRFTESLGKKVIILDVDSRYLDGPKGLLSKAPLNVTELPPDTSGRLNHFMFAMIHGYDYRLVQIPRAVGRTGTWTKVTAIKEALKHYKYVVFIDADAMILYPNLPIEWLFNYWEITPETLVAMALDPEAPHNHDWNGRTFLNTGFIIAQQSPRTHELFKAWETCPTETRYPDCARWGREWPHEQSAFGNHVRSEDIRVLSCAEANGCPEVASTGCVGELVRHYWGDKRSLPAAVGDAVLYYFLPQLHGSFYHNSRALVVNRTERAFT